MFRPGRKSETVLYFNEFSNRANSKKYEDFIHLYKLNNVSDGVDADNTQSVKNIVDVKIEAPDNIPPQKIVCFNRRFPDWL